MFPNKKKRNFDLILDNQYNRCEIEYSNYTQIKIDDNFIEERSDIYYNAHEHFRVEMLNNMIGDIWNKTEWSENYEQTKKVAKHDLSEIYSFIKHKFKDDTYSNSDVFVGIADFLDIDYKILYEMITPKFKQEIIKELDDKFHVLKRRRIYKLF